MAQYPRSAGCWRPSCDSGGQ